jgi:hypothetical protein
MASIEQTLTQFLQQIEQLQSDDDASRLRSIIEKWTADLDAATQ